MKKTLSYIAGGLLLATFVLASCGANKELTKQNQDLASNLESTRARVAELEKQLSAKDREIEDLTARIQGKEEERAALEGELAEVREQARELDVRVMSQEEELGRSRGEIAALSQDNGGRSREIVKLNDENRRLAKQLAALQDERNAALRESERLAGRINNLESSISAANGDLEGLKNERDELSASLGRLTDQNDTLQRQNAALEGEIAALKTVSEEDRERMEAAYNDLLADLNEEIDQKSVEIQRYRDALTITILNHIFFDSGKADIRPDGYGLLDRIAAIVQGLPGKIIKVEGHTDDVPIGPRLKSKYPTNWELGAARASAVARYFSGRHGIDPSRIVALSYSSHRPVVPNSSAANRAKNRRIEIVLTERSVYELLEIDRSLKVE